MKRRSLDLIIAIMLVFVTLLSGGLAQAYLAPDYSNPDFAPTGTTPFVIGPGVLPDYLTAPNWAFSPILNKFVDPLPGLCIPSAANSYCASNTAGAPDADPMKNKNIPVAVPDIVTYPGSDYYVIELRQYSEKMHTGLANPTTLRGYVQANNGTDTVSGGGCADPSINPLDPNNCTGADNTLIPAVQHFLGPVIVATKGRPVRVLFRNLIDPFVNGNLFLPVDDTIMGSGAYDINYNPQTMAMNPIDGGTGLPRVDSGMFSTNRATLHLHGGRSPWISDGTPHQWITPDIFNTAFDSSAEDTVYPQGVSVQNVPDMPTPAVGEQTFYWTNQQSSRMMFYHDHAWGITRLNVYAGEAAGYIIRDTVEQGLISSGVIPAAEIPLVLMDKTFVDATTIAATDPTWNWGTGAVTTPGAVTWVTVTNGGSGYTAIPGVAITGATGAGATAEAVLSTVVSSIALAAPNFGGSGYVAPIVIIDSPTDPNGMPATADAIIDGAGVITGFTITNGGSGYDPLIPPAVTIFDMNNDHTAGTTATAAATVISTVAAVAVTDGGSNYTDAVVTITPAGGDLTGGGALATATVTDIRAPKTGDLWWPHVYMPAQNPFDVTGVAPMGRWAYGPYFYPATNNLFQPVPNPYYSPLCDPLTATINTPGFIDGFCQAPEIPSTPNPSWGAEAFMDTPLVNGTAYPYLNLNPQSYRLRILNAAHDRFMNLSLLIADPSAATEVKMIDAAAPLPAGCPATWPPDGRAGGIPDCSTASNLLGPNWIMIGNEGGFLPMPVVIPPQVVTWNVNPSMFNVGNINGGSLILGPAERADVIVDFSDPKYHGKSLILYNDGAAPWPALNPQYDFYTNNPDGRPSGAADTTLAGKGPNTRTIMQINICTPGVGDCIAAAPAAYSLSRLQDAFDPTTQNGEDGPGVFRQAQDPIIAAQGNMNPGADPLYYETYLEAQDFSAYSRAYGAVGGAQAVFPTTYPNWGISRINDSIIKFKTLDDTGALVPTVQSIAMKRKSIHDEMGATFDDYGRMRAALGLERNFGGALQVNFIVQTYSSPVTEDLVPDGIQVWKITHNGVDTHPIHFHLFDVQVLNRVGWDGFIRLPDPTELGWKETVRISPLEDTIVAIRPVQPTLPFGLPTSYRPLNPATPIGSTVELTQIDPVTGNPRVTENAFKDFAWEYVWHCHILSHEENDMMRSMALHVVEAAPTAPTINSVIWPGGTQLDINWTDNAATEFSFRIERSVDGGGWSSIGTDIAKSNTGVITITSDNAAPGNSFLYRIVAIGAAGEATSNVMGYAFVPPTGVGTLAAVAANSGTINLTWTDSTGETSYQLQRKNGNCASLNAWADVAPAPVMNTAAYSNTGLVPSTMYAYRLRATNAWGSSAWSNCMTLSTPVIEAPTLNSATTTSALTIRLDWTDNSPTETGFQYRMKAAGACDGTGFGGATTVLGGANIVSTQVTGLSASTGYTFQVRSTRTGSGTSAWSGCQTATTDAAATTAPAAPSGVSASAGAVGQLVVVWTDNQPYSATASETNFQLQRKTGTVCDITGWSTVTSAIPADATTWTVGGLVSGTQYMFRVRAQNAAGSSAFSTCSAPVAAP